jgi:hypothetical protein
MPSAAEEPISVTESEVSALLDAHDALVRACVDESLSFAEFLAAYGDFPGNYGLDSKSADAAVRDVLRLFRRRIAFHSRVAGVLSGLSAVDDLTVTPYGDAAGFADKIGLMRLRALVVRYPEFKAEPEGIKSGMCT